MAEVLRDKNGHKMGEIRSQGRDMLAAYDANGHKLGEYNTKSGYTSDRNGHRLGSGNLLAGLVFTSKK